MSDAFGGHAADLRSFMNNLFDWASSAESIGGMPIKEATPDYFSWKLPFPYKLIEDSYQNRAIRAFCVQCLICKMEAISNEGREMVFSSGAFPEIVRTYCIITEPNLWGSEVGIVLSTDRWNKLLYRNVDISGFAERTAETGITLFERFGVSEPSGVSHLHMSHLIEDVEEQVSYRGGFHALWIDHSI
ncbi:MAG: DUF3916 domain-containing protein [Paracoccus sp. (in: a-proteobacteria)]|uniref:DUF3916 domain-containing protein n=1 Tax=Paracoccus sp. TaxID=267 RepID=UPI0026DEB6FF|nr:DUF3916 domain-containing protein [Paracoccus sp. (in: a-proteobacteria)]MDO5612247.1 DUF3916 domain-containing protein [Paracoccus sp. (in: a-proteobacteria)]